MTSLLERIKAHSEPAKVRRLEVPEWGTPPVLGENGEEIEPGKPLVITYTMVTLDDLATVSAVDGDEHYKRIARIVAMKALDENGQRLFTMTDAVTLREIASPAVVNRIGMSMLGGLTIEQAEKN